MLRKQEEVPFLKVLQASYQLGRGIHGLGINKPNSRGSAGPKRYACFQNIEMSCNGQDPVGLTQVVRAL